jgi:hypothetical protein
MPPVTDTLRVNPIVEFLRTYGPIAAAHSIWDEHVLAEAMRTGVEPIEVASARLEGLVENFRSEKPVSVILTGTAGDGKTWHCRRIYLALGGDPEAWETSGPMIEMPVGNKRLVIVKDLSQFHGQPELPEIMGRVLPALLGHDDTEVFLLAANDGQLLRFWRSFADGHPKARQIEERIRVLLKEERSIDPSLSMQLHNLSRQPHDLVFENVVDAIASHPGWQGCTGCALLDDGRCPIRRNLAVLSDGRDPGMRLRLRSLIRLAAYNDNHLPIRHVLLLAANIILGVSGRGTTLMRCSTAHAMAESGDLEAANPYDNALGLNLPEGTHGQYRAFTVFEDMGIGRETNNAVDSILVDAHPKDRYDAVVRSDPIFGNGKFEQVRSRYQRGVLEDFREFQQGIEQQRRRLFFSMPRGDVEPSLDPWRLTVFSYGGEYLDFAAALAEGRSIDFVRSRLVTGLNRSYTGAMCDESQQVWFASPAANTQSRLGRVLDIEVPVGRNKRFTYYFDFDCDANLAHGRPRMVVRLAHGNIIGSNAMTPLLFEYLLRVASGSLPGSFSRQCFEDLRQFRLRVVASLSRHDMVDIDALDDLRIIRVGADGALRQEAIEVIGSV